MAGEAGEAAEVLTVAAPLAAVAASAASPAAGPLVEAMIDAIARVLKEADIATAAGEVLTGEELLRRTAARLEAAAADPALPAEVKDLSGPVPSDPTTSPTTPAAPVAPASSATPSPAVPATGSEPAGGG